jgi:hypothetical protein
MLKCFSPLRQETPSRFSVLHPVFFLAPSRISLDPGPALPPLVPFSHLRSSFSSLEVYPLNFDEILSDPDLGSGTFSILRRTWTQECGVPRITGVEEIFAFGTVHPALPAQLELLPEAFSIDIPLELTNEIRAHAADKEACYQIGKVRI